MGRLGKEKLIEMMKKAIEVLNASEYRTRKRSIDRLTRLKDFLEGHWEDIERMNSSRWSQELALGKGLVWCSDYKKRGSYGYGGRNSNKNLPTGFIQADLKLKAKTGFILEAHVKDEDGDSDWEEFEFSDTHDMETVFGFSNIIDDFDAHLAEMERQQQTQRADVDVTKDAFKKTFAKEVLIWKTKQMRKE
jgi:hypothetical protein